jgi:hypothetical protein
MSRWVLMRTILGMVLVAAVGCGGDDAVQGGGKDAGNDSMPGAGRGDGGDQAPGTAGKGAGGDQAPGTAGKAAVNTKLSLPQVYPLVRASTPTALITNPMFKPEPPAPRDSGVGVLPQALGGAINLAIAVQERFYMGGPTEVLRIVKDLDDRIAGLDTDASRHTCLTSAPLEHTYALPGGQTFRVKLQCMQAFGASGSAGEGWIAFGFARPNAAMDDAGTEAADGGDDLERDDFYLVQGQASGMGGAYRISGSDVEAWIAVADSSAPMNSRVIMHLITHKVPAQSELALAGAGVGFCSGHLKTSPDFLYIEGKTNGAPPPGTGMTSGTQYCDASRAGCFAISALDVDLGAEAEGCSGIANRSFEIHGGLDASSDHGANVMADSIYTYFSQRPIGVTDF